MKIYLASASPRRSMLLKKIGINFERIFPKVEEILEEGINPETLVRRNAILKAKNVLNEIDEGIIIAADTIVVTDHNVLGKPKDTQEAYRMLMMLSGISHDVYTAVVVLEKSSNVMEITVEKTKVTMRKLSEEEVKEYIKSGEPLDAAGAYKIQEMGGKFIKRIEGCYYNVVGFPLATLIEMLRKFKVEI